MLSTLRLLQSHRDADVKAVGFATPALGNRALADYAKTAAFKDHFLNVLMPGVCQHPRHPQSITWKQPVKHMYGCVPSQLSSSM